MDADDVDLIARIYDTALDPEIWPELMLRIAHKLGAAGSFIFELRLDDDHPQIASRIFSANYVPEIVRDYLIRFNAEEIDDQGRFATLSARADAVDLISDVHLRPQVSDLLAQPNTAFMMKHGLKHRAGALLNKDLLNIDRFALQYSLDHGPITESERRKAVLFLPHIAKVIGLARPLEEHFLTRAAFEEILGQSDQGIAILSPSGTLIYRNAEFDRVLETHRVFRLSPGGVLQVRQDELARKYHDLLTDADAHGRHGARARREALVFPLGGDGAAIFAEICPVDESRLTGRLGAGCRLLTLIDSSRPVRFDLSRISKFYQLSPSEADILGLIAEGHGNQEIAERRDRSPDTIKTQIKGLMRKTNSENRMDLVHMVRNLSSPVRYQAQR
ncbi:MAG: helix-turn-helix domain-containing protein [Rhizobiaceae bacterium]